MHVIIKRFKLYFLLVVFPAIILVLLTCGCDKKEDKKQEKKEEKKSASICDKPLADFQYKLLDTAFETATSIPVDPHIKDRSKAQEAAVEACLELGQPKKAIGFIEKVENWRQSQCYASLALYFAQHGDANQVKQYLILASQIAAKIAAKDELQDWQRDRIKVKIAQTEAWLKQPEQDAKFEEGLVDSEKGKVIGIKAVVADDNSFDEQMKAISALTAKDNFDISKNALESCTQLFNRYYADTKRRSLAEEKIKTSWEKLPIPIRMELLMKLTEFALNHSDKVKAIELINESQAYFDKYQWRPEGHIPVMARLAKLYFLAGDVQMAKTDANAAIAIFDKEKQYILNVDRAGVLRPLAQTYMSIGDKAAALAIYKRVIEEGMESINSRPRAEELSATCCSMALSGLEPDAELWTRIEQIKNGLGDPW